MAEKDVLDDIEREIILRMRDCWMTLHREEKISPQLAAVRAVVGECGSMLTWAVETARAAE